MVEEKNSEPEQTGLEPEGDSVDAAQNAAQNAAQDIEGLQNELKAWQDKAGEYLEGWQRARAEFTNYKRRVERDQAQVYQNATGQVIKRYLDVIDDLERALKDRPQDGTGASWAAGIELIDRKLRAILDAEGVKSMDALGQFFDPNLHEALAQADSPDHESGQIIDVVKQGYMLGERVLRPALVRVAK